MSEGTSKGKREKAVDVLAIREEANELFSTAALAAKKTLALMQTFEFDAPDKRTANEQAARKELAETIEAGAATLSTWRKDIAADLEAKIGALAAAPGRKMEDIAESTYQVTLLSTLDDEAGRAAAVWKHLARSIENLDISAIRACCDFFEVSGEIEFLSVEKRSVVDRLLAASNPEKHALKTARAHSAYTSAFLSVVEKALSVLADSTARSIKALESEIAAEFEQPAPEFAPAQSFAEALTSASPEQADRLEAQRKQNAAEADRENRARREAANAARKERNGNAQGCWSGTNVPYPTGDRRRGAAASLAAAIALVD